MLDEDFHDSGIRSSLFGMVACIVIFMASAFAYCLANDDRATLRYVDELLKQEKVARLPDAVDEAEAQVNKWFFIPIKKRNKEAELLRKGLKAQHKLLDEKFKLGNKQDVVLMQEASVRGYLFRYAIAEVRPTAFGSLTSWRTWWNWMSELCTPEGILKLALIVVLQCVATLSLLGLLMLIAVNVWRFFRKGDEDSYLDDNPAGDITRVCVAGSGILVAALLELIAVLVVFELLVAGQHFLMIWISEPDNFFNIAGWIGMIGYVIIAIIITILGVFLWILLQAGGRLILLALLIPGIVFLPLHCVWMSWLY